MPFRAIVAWQYLHDSGGDGETEEKTALVKKDNELHDLPVTEGSKRWHSNVGIPVAYFCPFIFELL